MIIFKRLSGYFARFASILGRLQDKISTNICTWDDSQMIKTSFTNTFTIAVERFYLYHPYFLILQEDYSTWGRLWGRGWANKVPQVQRYSSDLFYALTENFVSVPNKYLIKNLSTHQAAVQQSGAARRADVRSGKVRLRLHFMSYFNTR